MCSGEAAVSSVSGDGKTGQLHVKIKRNERFLTSYTKIKEKMDQTPNCKAGNHETPRRKCRQNFDMNCSSIFFFFDLKDKGNQSKNKKWDMI